MCPLKILSVINQEIINEKKVISMRKSVKKIIGTGILAMTILTTNVSAATGPVYSFNLSNTGKSLQIDRNSKNRKVYAGQSWTFKPYHLSTGKSPYGMLFAPYGNGTFYSSAQIWRKTGQYNKVYIGFSKGKAGDYWLPSRIDDDYNGPFASDGWWNADTVTG